MLRLRNPHSDSVAFKVSICNETHETRLSTDLHALYRSRLQRPNSMPPPRSPVCQAHKHVIRYCVRPNSGKIEAGGSVEVQGQDKHIVGRGTKLTERSSPPGNARGSASRSEMQGQISCSVSGGRL